LIRALVEVGGLSLSRVRDVLAEVDEESRELHGVLGAAHSALVPEPPAVSTESKERVERLINDRGWLVYEGSVDRALLAAALDALVGVGHRLDDETLQAYAQAAQQVADADVAHLPVGDRSRTVEAAVVVTALGGPVLLTLRRLAQESASARRYGIKHPS
jgi:hypothetical protein